AYLLHADILHWSSAMLPQVYYGDVCIFPAQSAAARLEWVLLTAVRDFIAAECWEEAAALLDRLAARYASVTAEYSKLSRALRQKASLLHRISHLPRLKQTYYFVYYAGHAFPASLRRKLFIYAGNLAEHISEFEPRILRKWPGSVKQPLKLHAHVLQAARGLLCTTDGGAAPHRDIEAVHAIVDVDALWDDETDVLPAGASSDAATDTQAQGSVDAAPYSIQLAAATLVPYVPVHPLYHLSPLEVTSDAAGECSGGGVSGPEEAAAAGGRTKSYSMCADDVASTLALSRSGMPGAPPPAASLEASGGAQRSVWRCIQEDQQAGAAAAAAATARPVLITRGAQHVGARFFMHQRPFRKRATKTANEFMDLWVSRTYAITDAAFPCTH
ncbi:MAG: hypothetical protein EOO41_04930, partial [Methanobacteriota archaeon]